MWARGRASSETLARKRKHGVGYVTLLTRPLCPVFYNFLFSSAATSHVIDASIVAATAGTAAGEAAASTTV